MNTPVSFQMAELLKEKGISFETEIYYSSVTKVTSVSYTEIAAPTIADVVMWLYEKHEIWVIVDIIFDNIDFFPRWDYKVVNVEQLQRPYNDFAINAFESPRIAYEAAIEYTLNNLI